MLKKLECKIYRDEDYAVEVMKSKKDEKMIEFWLSKIGYGIKILMFAVEINYNDDSEIEDFIKRNIAEYKEIYHNDYED